MTTQLVTSDQIYRFPVALHKVYTRSMNGGVDDLLEEVPRSRAVVRIDTGKPLCTVSSKYELHTHAEVMDAAAPFVEQMGKHSTTYSLEKEGAQLIATHTFPEITFKVPRAHDATIEERRVGDVVALQLHIINSYDRTTSVSFKLGGKVLRCLNGATLFQELFSFRFTHAPGNWDKTLPHPGDLHAALDSMGQIYTRWSETEIDAKTIKALVELSIKTGVLPTRYYLKEQERFSRSKTIWDLYQANTYVISHSNDKLRQSGRLKKFDSLNSIFRSHFEGATEVDAEVIQ